MTGFSINAKFPLSNEQRNSVLTMVNGIHDQHENQMLLGITGSGKTFTMANIIQEINQPTLIICPNKTLSNQLYQEFTALFPNNAVKYFVSFYDYYRPEAYLVAKDVYMEQKSIINNEINRMRNDATHALLTRKDTIILASVSSIYGICAPSEYIESTLFINEGESYTFEKLMQKLEELGYAETQKLSSNGKFKTTRTENTDYIDLFPANEKKKILKITIHNGVIHRINAKDFSTNKSIPLSKVEQSSYLKNQINSVAICPCSHFTSQKQSRNTLINKIQKELDMQYNFFINNNEEKKATRLKKKIEFDMRNIQETGRCKGMENYSIYLEDRDVNDPPNTLISFFKKNEHLLFIDESHIAIPQIQSMYKVDITRKNTLVEHGYRLPSCLGNRPLKFDEFMAQKSKTIYVSATPSKWEYQHCTNKVEQIIRPTGLLDPICTVIPTAEQINTTVQEIEKVIANNNRIILITATKKMSEILNDYMKSLSFKSAYLHSDIPTLKRSEIIKSFRTGQYDVLIGINLLREGIDIPECELICIFDADKDGYLRSETALIQIIGRAARNNKGRVIMFADRITKSMKAAIDITHNRRELQKQHNIKNNITPKTTTSNTNIHQETDIKILRMQMQQAAEDRRFEEAAKIRDKIKHLEHQDQK